MRSAQSRYSVFPPAGARTCEANHKGIEGEHSAQYARLSWCKEEHTFTKHQSWGGWTILESGCKQWEPQSKNPPDSRRRTHFWYLYEFVLYSVTRLKTCHFTDGFTRVCVALFYSTNIGELFQSRGLITSEPMGTHPRSQTRVANIFLTLWPLR